MKVKQFKYEIEFDKQAFLLMDKYSSNWNEAQVSAMLILEKCGFRITPTRDVRAIDLPLLHHCVHKTAEQLGIHPTVKIGVRLSFSRIGSTFFNCVDAVWQLGGGALRLMPYSVQNVELLVEIARRLTSLKEVNVYESFEDTFRELLPEPSFTDRHFVSDLDAVVLGDTVSLRWENWEASGPTLNIRQVLRKLDEITLRKQPQEGAEFIHLQLTRYQDSLVKLPLRGSYRVFDLAPDNAPNTLLTFLGYFPRDTARTLSQYVDVLLRYQGRKFRRKASINIEAYDGEELQVSYPDLVRFPRSRLYGYTGKPTQALAAAHIVLLLDEQPVRRRRVGNRFVE